MLTYWVFCCGLFPDLMLGKDAILQLIQPQRLTLQISLLLLIPLIGAGLYRFVPGMAYEKPRWWLSLLLFSSCLGNGFFEELLWRSLYLELFPDNLLLGMI